MGGTHIIYARLAEDAYSEAAYVRMACFTDNPFVKTLFPGRFRQHERLEERIVFAYADKELVRDEHGRRFDGWADHAIVPADELGLFVAMERWQLLHPAAPEVLLRALGRYVLEERQQYLPRFAERIDKVERELQRTA